METDPQEKPDGTPEDEQSSASAGSPVYVPLHESSAPLVPAGTWVRECITETLPDGRKVMAGKIAEDQGVMIRITRPLEDGTHSRLDFGLSWDAVKALHDVLCASICTRENDEAMRGGSDA